MTDEPGKTGPPDAELISLEQPHEVRHWTGRLGVSEQRLRQVVARVGTSVVAVERVLRSH